MTLSPKRAVRLAAVLAVLLLLFGEIALILRTNGGHFVYTLDDPYIHLAVAEEIARGGYGVNPGEPSAPSSSVLWPLLLAPFGAPEWLPLAFNALLSVAIAIALAGIVAAALPVASGAKLTPLRVTLAVLLVLSTNVVGLALSGMEHSAHLLVTLLLVLGFWIEARTGRLPAWLPAVLVVGPLIRYEALAFSAPGIALLAIRGHRRTALACAFLVAIPLGGFALFLHSQGLGLVPTSVLVKSDAVSNRSIASFVSTAHANLEDRQGGMLALLGLAAAAAIPNRRRSRGERLFAAWAVAGIALHLAAGQFGWYHRYEIYAFAAALAAALLVHGVALATLAARRLPLAIAGSAILLAILGEPYWNALRTIPIASANIYEQQFQMHRFVTDFWRAPVAVNDLGAVAYHNDEYVLDLWGLASASALRHRRAAEGAGWMDDLAREHGVRLAMIYSKWFPELPKRWVPLADLTFHKKPITAAGPTVTFYALDDSARVRALPLLDHFGASLPASVTLELREPRAAP